MVRALAKHFGCASEFTLQMLGGKWKTAILCLLKEGGTLRYGQLRKFLPPRLSDKMFIQRLKELEALGLIAKSATPGSRATRYRLTERGNSLRVVLTAIYHWGDRHAAAYGVKCDNPVRAARESGMGKK